MESLEDWREIVESDEELHPDLQPYLVDITGLGPCLKHPYVFEVPFFSAGIANRAYKQKVDALEDALTTGRWTSYVFLHERPYRFRAFAQIYEGLTEREFWELLREIWIDSENIFENPDVQTYLEFPNSHLMMTDEEFQALAEMPDHITVYRGVAADYEDSRLGWSWTLDENQARWFAGRFSRDGILIEAQVHKGNVIAYITGRNEQEILVNPVWVKEVALSKVSPS